MAERYENLSIESTPKNQKPLNPLKGTLKSSLIFNEFPPAGGSGVRKLKINELRLFGMDSSIALTKMASGAD
jgi:hypothetical protein